MILGELATLEAAIGGRSIARFGDGELRNAVGGTCISQVPNDELAAELRLLLAGGAVSLACIPNPETPRRDVWSRYFASPYRELCRAPVYGSSFITRPDSAPWIDTDAYWQRVESLWRGRDVTLVAGTAKSLTTDLMKSAARIREIPCAARDAYSQIDELEEEIGAPSGPVLLCCGPTATVLAERLARKGLWALDLGHIGMFLRHQGAYRFTLGDLASLEYREQLEAVHAATKGWGGDGAKHADDVANYARRLCVRSVLDYGCGRGALADALRSACPNLKLQGFDAGFSDKAHLPKPADLVVCTDMLEHVEADKLANVLEHQFRLAAYAAFFVIATRPANQILPDGRNAHLLVRDSAWWREQVERAGWKISAVRERPGHEIALWLTK